MDALAAGYDAAVQMIDTSIADNNHQDMGRSSHPLDHQILKWDTFRVV
jgi:hypothetical protein